MSGTERRPFEGRTIVVTRSREQAGELVDALEALGANVLCFPTIAIVDPQDLTPLDAALRDLAGYDWVLFTSTNTVERVFARLAALGIDGATALAGAQVAAVGDATAARLAAHGLTADLVPADHHAEGLLEALASRGVQPGARFLLPRAEEAREVLPETLRERGAVVDVVPAYRTVTGPGDDAVAARLRAGEADAVTFTSGSTVRNFLSLLGEEDARRILDGVVVGSIGPVTTRALEKRGLRADVEASPCTVAGLVEALAAHFRV